jgi:hypothetical protein
MRKLLIFVNLLVHDDTLMTIETLYLFYLHLQKLSWSCYEQTQVAYVYNVS